MIDLFRACSCLFHATSGNPRTIKRKLKRALISAFYWKVAATNFMAFSPFCLFRDREESNLVREVGARERKIRADDCRALKLRAARCHKERCVPPRESHSAEIRVYRENFFSFSFCRRYEGGRESSQES